MGIDDEVDALASKLTLMSSYSKYTIALKKRFERSTPRTKTWEIHPTTIWLQFCKERLLSSMELDPKLKLNMLRLGTR